MTVLGLAHLPESEPSIDHYGVTLKTILPQLLCLSVYVCDHPSRLTPLLDLCNAGKAKHLLHFAVHTGEVVQDMTILSEYISRGLLPSLQSVAIAEPYDEDRPYHVVKAEPVLHLLELIAKQDLPLTEIRLCLLATSQDNARVVVPTTTCIAPSKHEI